MCEGFVGLMQRFQGGLVFKSHRLCASLNSMLEGNKEEGEGRGGEGAQTEACSRVPLVQRFRGGPVFKAHRLLYHSTLGLRVIKKKQKGRGGGNAQTEACSKEPLQARVQPPPSTLQPHPRCQRCPPWTVQGYLAHKKQPRSRGPP